MKFVVSQDVIASHIATVSRVIPSRPSHPILANILFDADFETSTVALTGFDLSMGVITSFDCLVQDSGKLCLPAKLLGDIVSRLPDGDLTFELEDSGEVTISASSGTYRVRASGVEEYPELPIVSGDDFSIYSEMLKDCLNAALFAASSDETKQVLTGLHFASKDDLFEVFATDGHRMSVVSINGVPTEFSVTIPAKALREVDKILGGCDQVSIESEPSLMRFECGNTTLITRLIEGQYPDCKKLIPQSFSKVAILDRKQLISALERISVIADQKNSIVKMGFGDQLIISVDAQDIGSGKEVLACQYSGDVIDIAFNSKYLIEGLKSMSTAEIQISMNLPTDPAVIEPLGSEMKHQYLTMPCQIRS